jgi:hypothetical protein
VGNRHNLHTFGPGSFDKDQWESPIPGNQSQSSHAHALGELQQFLPTLGVCGPARATDSALRIGDKLDEVGDHGGGRVLFTDSRKRFLEGKSFSKKGAIRFLERSNFLREELSPFEADQIEAEQVGTVSGRYTIGRNIL